MFSCTWSNPNGQVEYTISLTENRDLPAQVAVRESITLTVPSDFPAPDQVGLSTGENGRLDKIILRETIL